MRCASHGYPGPGLGRPQLCEVLLDDLLPWQPRCYALAVFVLFVHVHGNFLQPLTGICAQVVAAANEEGSPGRGTLVRLDRRTGATLTLRERTAEGQVSRPWSVWLLPSPFPTASISFALLSHQT
jgi:hypothetical protein